MKRYVPIAGVVLALLLVACGNDDDDDGVIPTGAIDRDAILGSVEDVRSMIEDSDVGLDTAIIDDVSYSENSLTVQLNESQDDLDTSGLEELCQDVVDAVDLDDLSVTVEKSDGSESVDCDLGG